MVFKSLKKTPEPWVVCQHRTMTRWVSSAIEVQVNDFTTDLADGLVLYKLVNYIISQTGNSYELKPVYPKPNFKLQKVENVDDVLKYCQLVLKINTCSISADNVVAGDLKLILGLIWTLFVYSTSNTICLQNDGRSFSEIKSILLRWLNELAKRRALPEIRNFDKDWSLQTDARPDLVLASVLEYYIPNLVNYSELLLGKKLHNLEHIIGQAFEKLKIPKLAEADDFNVLVPDDKCIIFYVLLWYMFFEVQELPEELQSLKMTDLEHIFNFVSEAVEAVKIRNKFETRALRLVNQIGNNISRLTVMLAHIDKYVVLANLETMLSNYCADFDMNNALGPQIASRENWTQISALVATVTELLERFRNFREVLRPDYVFHDYPELQSLQKSVNAKLKEIGIYSGYIPLKLLSLESLGVRLNRLLVVDQEVAAKLSVQVEHILASKATKLDSLIQSLESSLQSCSDSELVDTTRKYIDTVDVVQNFRADLATAQEFLQISHTTSDLRTMIDSMETLQFPVTPDTPQESEFGQFKELVQLQKNKTNLTFSDARAFMKKILPLVDAGSSPVSEFLKLIPTRRLLNRSESDDFGTLYSSDDSIESAPIFDDVLKTLEHKLLGNHNKLYDLEALVFKMENGFWV